MRIEFAGKPAGSRERRESEVCGVHRPEYHTFRRAEQAPETVSWGLFLILSGALALAPDGAIPRGTWLLGVGMIMLWLNAARRRRSIPISGFTVALGAVATVLGIGSLAGVAVPVLPVILLVAGAYLILSPFLGRHGR